MVELEPSKTASTFPLKYCMRVVAQSRDHISLITQLPVFEQSTVVSQALTKLVS